MLNLCDASLKQETPYGADRRKLMRAIRPRVKVDAVRELTRHRDQIEQLSRVRELTVPDLWSVLESYVVRDKAPNVQERKYMTSLS